MEPSQQDQLSQQSTGSHVLHPEADTQNLPIIQPSILSSAPEQVAVPSSEPKRYVRNGVLRPGDAVTTSMMNKAKALAMAGVVGLSGAMMTDNAKAQGIPGLEQTGKVWVAGAINGVINHIIPGIPGALAVDSRGNPLIVTKTPAQMAMSLTPRISQETMNYANLIGINIRDIGKIVILENRANRNEYLEYKKVTTENHYLTGLNIKQISESEGGGLSIIANWNEKDPISGRMVAKQQEAILVVDKGKIIPSFRGDKPF